MGPQSNPEGQPMSDEKQTAVSPDNTTDPMLQFFKWKHLPENLQTVSRPFASLAAAVVRSLPRCPERTSALRHLLEAKDCAVRSRLAPETVTVHDLD